MCEPGGVVEQVARSSYGRLLAFISARSRDVVAAEDALAEAFQAALVHWPTEGVPEKPEAWLLVTARRKLIDQARQRRNGEAVAATLLAVAGEAYEMASHEREFPDERLQLMFVCAHPAIDRAARTPLMLQTVLGLDAARIASAFLIKPSTMGQRLSRVKAKIRDARIPFEVPERSQLSERLDAVLEAVYAAYGAGWGDFDGAAVRQRDLAKEAISLGYLLLQLLPDEPEVMGLLALMLNCEARRHARLGTDGLYIPLSEQDPQRWDWDLLEQAHRLLLRAETAKKIGCFQLEAAIQSTHTRRAHTGSTDWEELEILYEGIVRLCPTVGAMVGRAAAAAHVKGAEYGWTLLSEIPQESASMYQPYWAVACHLLAQMERIPEAVVACERATRLCNDPAVRLFLESRARQWRKSGHMDQQQN
jgi:RNA polymerase sigma-70 factor (ECF subfamily)